jgi:hypothetical protein
MYGLPSDFDPAIFTNRELERVTFGANVIVLGFSNDLTVSISGSLPYEDVSGVERIDRPPTASTRLIGLVGQSIRGVDLKSPKELLLRFERGSVTLLDDSEFYECYLIHDGDREIVV